jgi:hypothetical protein
MSSVWLRSLGCFFALACAVGCGGGKLYSVDGTVVYRDGQVANELAGGSVEFDPVQGKEGARGEIGPDGSFRLGTHRPGDGAAPGEYRVSIQPPVADLDRRGKRVLPRRYEDFKTSGLRVTVRPEPNRVTLTVERPDTRP